MTLNSIKGEVFNTGQVSQLITQGKVFSHTLKDTALASAASLEVLIIVGASEAHLRVKAGGATASNLLLFQATTVSGNGTAMPPRNRNRRFTVPPLTTVLSGPTITGDGTGLSDKIVPETDSPDANAWILLANTNYLVRLTNVSGATAPVSLEIDIKE